MSDHPLVKAILQKHDLVEYLSQLGYHPVSHSGRYLRYLCPLHKETDGSFFVWPGERPHYYCFGCKSGGDVISFVAAIEHLTLKQAFAKLLRGIEVDNVNVIADAAAKMREESKNQKTLEDYAFHFAHMFRTYMSSVGNDTIELQFLESVFAKVDEQIHAANIDILEDIFELLVDKLFQRQTWYFEQKEKRQMKLHAGG